MAIRRPDVLLHGFLGLSLVEGEIVKGFDVGLVLVRAGHGSLLQFKYVDRLLSANKYLLVINVSSTG